MKCHWRARFNPSKSERFATSWCLAAQTLEMLFSIFPSCTYTWMRPTFLGEGSWTGLVSPSYSFLEYVISGNAFVDMAFAEVHDFIEYPMLVQVFIEFVFWALLKVPFVWPLRSRGGWRWLRLLVVFLPFSPCTATVRGAPGHNRGGVVSETTLLAKTQGGLWTVFLTSFGSGQRHA